MSFTRVCSSTFGIRPVSSQKTSAFSSRADFFSSTFLQGFGIFKSTDAGATWSQLPGTVGDGVPADAFEYVNKVVVSPNDSNRVYAATRTGVWRSIVVTQRNGFESQLPRIGVGRYVFVRRVRDDEGGMALAERLDRHLEYLGRTRAQHDVLWRHPVLSCEAVEQPLT